MTEDEAKQLVYDLTEEFSVSQVLDWIAEELAECDSPSREYWQAIQHVVESAARVIRNQLEHV